MEERKGEKRREMMGGEETRNEKRGERREEKSREEGREKRR